MIIAALLGGNLGNIIIDRLIERYNLVCVLTDHGSPSLVNKCLKNNIPLFVGNPRKGRGYSFLKGFEVDILISVNYLFLIEKDIIELPRIAAFNIHGSLLPKYRGRTPHVWSIINNEKDAGVTAHLIDVGCDTGGILRQIRVPIEPDDTGASLLSKYTPIYSELMESVLKDFSEGKCTATPQSEYKATFFGKRVPDDGQINWNWHKERIRNWVRAQSDPYPGAFTFYEVHKITIDWIEFSDSGFSDSMPNGLILSLSPLLVKTPNGVVELIRVRPNSANLEIGKIFKSA